MQLTGHTAMQGASVQCMHEIEIDFSPGWPSPIVTTRRRSMPQGTSCSFLQAVAQALHSMHRSASQEFHAGHGCVLFTRGSRPLERQSVVLVSCM